MFRCSFCNALTQRGEPMTRVPMETRAKTYPFRERANRYSMKKRDWPDDPGGKGLETVKEGQACPRCVEVQGVPGATYINPDL